MTIDLRTVSDGFRVEIGEGERVIAAVFTTYRFEPDFFEQEILPLMLDQDLAFSSDQRIKSIQVREALSDAGIPIEVFYDIDLFRQQGTVSPSMEYLHHGIRGDRSAFHAKIILLLLEDTHRGERSLCVGAGSANLTIAGWWENIECMHWERVVSGEASRPFLRRLREDVAWLAAHRKGAPGHPEHALPMIAGFLEACRGSNSAPVVSWYGLTSLVLGQKRRPPFVRFLLDALTEQSSYYKRWSLEIISPYFAESPDFTAHEHFFKDFGVENIRIFLPVNDQGEALCRRDYYDKIEDSDGIEWATWTSDMTKALGLKQQVHRTTHAKIYHFYNGVQSWVFIGSVNFTHRATTDNQEAGFFTRLPTQVTLLKPLREDPVKWCPEDQLTDDDADPGKRQPVPDLALCYDWKSQVLFAALGERESGRAVDIDILSPEGSASVTGISVSQEHARIECDPEVIQALLKTSGYLRVRGKWQPGEEPFPEHDVMVQQLHWTHKPLDLPKLSPQEIMQIYAGLSQDRRNQVIALLKERQLREMGLLGESAGSAEYEDQGRQFFAEYAELFHAFRNLRRRMDEALAQERIALVDYYLSGRGMDSLPTLLESLYEEDRKLDGVTIYLALLCLVQLYDRKEYRVRPQASGYLDECRDKLKQLELSDRLVLIDHQDNERRQRFFDWYREQFFREYRALEDKEPDASY